MERLSEADLLALLRCVEEIAVIGDLDGFRARSMSAVRALFPCDLITYSEIDLRRQKTIIVMDPAETAIAGIEEALARHAGEHPLIAFYQQSRDGRAIKLSDFLSQRRLHDLGLYREVFRPVGVEYQMVATLFGGSSRFMGFTVQDELTDFSERDRLLLNLLRPHLAMAYHNADTFTRLQEAVGAAGLAVIVLSADGRIETATPQAWQWLSTYFAGPRERTSGLPDRLRAWVRYEQSRCADASDAPVPAPPLIVERDGKRLIVRFLPGGRMSEQHSLLMEEELVALPVESLAPLGLGRRESDVLAWVARGSTNAEIGNLLGISLRTVEKHLEAIYRKLGVTNRTAAVALALQPARGRGGPEAE